MSGASPEALAVTRRAFLASLVVLLVLALVGIATWSMEPWRAGVVVAGCTTYLFAALFGFLLLEERWPALRDFGQLNSWVVPVFIMGSAAALLFYVSYPDPVMLLVGPFVMAFVLLVGWGMEKVHLFGW